MPPVPEPFPPVYRLAMGVCAPAVRWWGRLETVGLEALPATGPALLVLNHDSYWDPVAVGVAALRRRPIRALAKSSLWKVPALGPVLDGMGQIPIARGARDEAAMARAVQALRDGACLGVFPEGTRSLGRVLRARSGLGRLAQAVPEAALVCCAVTGATDIPRFPHRPRVRVAFWRPAEGSRPGEAPAELGARLLEEIRRQAPVVAAGRRPR